MYGELVYLTWISIFPNLRLLEPLMKAYVRNQLITSAAIYLAFICYLSFLWLIVSSFVVDAIQVPAWTQIRRSGGAYIKASVLIIIGYATLLAVNPRYVSLLILPVLMLVFIGALFVIVSMKGSLDLKCHQDRNTSDASNVTPASEEDGNGGLLVGDKKDDGLFQIAVAPCWLLFCTGYFKADNLVFSQFLLFLSSSLGELALMLAKLPSQVVAPAFEAVHRASLVAVLLAAHTMAAELLGDHAVLVCTPELVVALGWLAIHLAHGVTTTVSTVEEALRKADIAVLGVVPIVTYLVLPTRDESGGETNNLLSSYMSDSVACGISVILPSLCLFVLRQWRRQATEAPSSELEGSIRLLTLCRDILLKAEAIFLISKPVVDARLRLQMQGLATDMWSTFLQGRT